MIRPVVYNGEEDYICISYSHRNSRLVWDMLNDLQEDGYRFWYDDGIDLGSEWDESIAGHIEGCSCYIAFVTREYAASKSCIDDLRYAVTLRKNILIVYMDEVQLLAGMRMRLAQYKKINYCELGRAECLKIIESTEGIERCRIAPAQGKTVECPEEGEGPTCYDGDMPYVFISYAHRDTEHVLPVLRRMQQDGFRIWYDDGIDPGSEWDEYIASHVAKCGCFIAFLSKNYVDSENCRDEVNYARQLNRSRLLIYLEDVELTEGMAMRLNRLQALYYYRYPEKTQFYKRLYMSSALTETNVRDKERIG